MRDRHIVERFTFEKGETLSINADVEGWRAKKGDSSSLPADSNAGVSEPPIQAEDRPLL